jgi:hypothetical protein
MVFNALYQRRLSKLFFNALFKINIHCRFQHQFSMRVFNVILIAIFQAILQLHFSTPLLNALF